MSKPIPLTEWAANLSTCPPSERTLRRWVSDGRIFPRPRKIGRRYFADPKARYIDTSDPDYMTEVAAALNESTSQ